MKQQDERQSDGYLGRGHRQNEEKHDLPIGLAPAGARRNEGQAAGIEHDLDAHQRENKVTAREESGETQYEQDRGQNLSVLHRYL